MNYRMKSDDMNGRRFGVSQDGKTIVLGDINEPIVRILIDGDGQFAPNDFPMALHCFGNISEIHNHDYQEFVLGLLKAKP